jgi:predicted dehydrogenase
VTTYRVGVIGVGHLGSLHAKMLADLPGAILSGVYDNDAARAQKVAEENRTIAVKDVAGLIAQSDAVTIATPTSTHCAVARQVVEAGKHLLIEKPITQTVEEAEIICRLARDKGIVLQVGHIERFNPAILALEPYVLKPLFIESHRLSQFNTRGTDVAVVLDLMIHDIDLILSFVQSPVRSVDANGVAVVSDTIDIANARLQFENGCVANVTASRISQRRMRKMRLFQPDTYISIDFSEGMSEVFRLTGEGDPMVKGTLVLGELGAGTRKKKILYEQPEVKEINALQYEIGTFLHAIRTGTPPPVSGEDGKRALEVADIIMKKISQQGLSH